MLVLPNSVSRQAINNNITPKNLFSIFHNPKYLPHSHRTCDFFTILPDIATGRVSFMVHHHTVINDTHIQIIEIIPISANTIFLLLSESCGATICTLTFLIHNCNFQTTVKSFLRWSLKVSR